MTGSSTEEIIEAIRVFIAEECDVAPDDEELTDGVHLFDAGYLDSIRLVSLLAHLEQRFGVRLPEEALFSEDFTHINGMARLVAASLAPAESGRAVTGSTAEPAHEHPQVRPLSRDDLPGVAQLYERVERSGKRQPPPGLAAAFGRHFLDSPHFDASTPSLVHLTDGRIDGFLGIHPRRFRFRGRPLRLACVGQFVADPDTGTGAIGTRLLARCMSGPQELTITDGGTPEVAAMWKGHGGRPRAVANVWWMRLFHPCRLATDYAARRSGAIRAIVPAGRALAGIADAGIRAFTGHRFRAPRTTLTARALTAADLLEALDRLGPAWCLVPDWDEPFLDWLLTEVAAVRSRGRLRAMRVSTDDGLFLGWYLYYLPRNGVGQVLQVAALPGRERDVLEKLFTDAEDGGAVGVQGRVEPALLPALSELDVTLRHAWCHSLARVNDAELAPIVHGGDALLTRLEGEWWCGFQLEPYADA